MDWEIYDNNNQKKAVVVIRNCEKANFRARKVTKDKERHHIMIRKATF